MDRAAAAKSSHVFFYRPARIFIDQEQVADKLGVRKDQDELLWPPLQQRQSPFDAPDELAIAFGTFAVDVIRVEFAPIIDDPRPPLLRRRPDTRRRC